MNCLKGRHTGLLSFPSHLPLELSTVETNNSLLCSTGKVLIPDPDPLNIGNLNSANGFLTCMNKLVRDFSTHPLLPGSVLASTLGDPRIQTRPHHDYATLVEFNQMPHDQILQYHLEAGIVTADQLEKLKSANAEFTGAYQKLQKQIPDIAWTTDCLEDSIFQLARALFSARLMAETLEITTPPQLSYEKTREGTVDLLEKLFDSFRKIVGGAWAVFFPYSEYNLTTDASAQFWVACLYSTQPDDMVRTFIGYFRSQHKDRFQTLNQGVAHPKPKGLYLQDAITDYLDHSREKIKQLHESTDKNVRAGLEHAFQDIAKVISQLELPWIVLLYYEFLTREICEAFSTMDGRVSAKESRFIQYLLDEVSRVAYEYHNAVIDHLHPSAPDKLDKLFQELDALVGLEDVKTKVKQTANFAKVQQMRVTQGLRAIPTSYHAVFTGRPGTGKTTVARLLGRIYRCLGVLKKGHLVECDRSSLVAEYVGQTAPKTNRIIDSALDGILFIDEAYTLVRETESFGQEAIDTLIKRMEDERERLIVIVAGYPQEMEEFVHSNPGLHSRFNRFIPFPDYAPQELARIFAQMCRRHGLQLTPDLKEKTLHYFILEHQERGENFGNARLARNCFEKVINAQASRLAKSDQYDTKSLATLEATDLVSAAAEQAMNQHRRKGGQYVIHCHHCRQVYRWSPEMNIIDAQCTECEEIYNCEFGQPE